MSFCSAVNCLKRRRLELGQVRYELLCHETQMPRGGLRQDYDGRAEFRGAAPRCKKQLSNAATSCRTLYCRLVDGFLQSLLGFRIIATGGTAAHLEDQGLPVERVNKVAQGRPHIVDKLTDGDVQLVFNTTEGWQSLKDSFSIRTTALNRKVPYFTTAAASFAAARSIGALRGHALEVKSLQSYYSASKH